MPKGKIKKIYHNHSREFGLIESEDKQLIIYFSSDYRTGHAPLNVGDIVCFEAEPTNDGIVAKRISRE